MPHEILFREQYGVLGRKTVYIKPPDQNSIVRLGSSLTLPKTLYQVVADFFRQVFLPQGYPESVSDDYCNYQIWDTVQAFCSTITGTLTTQAVMKGVGVGNTEATPLAAAITWILKDGTGMVGRISFAWWKGSCLDADCKKWRLCADFLNDLAMFLELLLPYLLDYSTQILCISTTMKAIVGVAGGATRAAITQHQAIRENMADVSAKDGSQETFVNLAASIIGIVILTTLKEGEYVWQLFALFTTIHLFANYRAVRALKMLTLNSSRLALLLDTYLASEIIPSPETVNSDESVILGLGLSEKELCGYNIVLGTSMKAVLSSGMVSADDMKLVVNFYHKRKYLLIIDREEKIIYVSLQQKEKPADVIQAYFHAVLLGITTCILSDIHIPLLDKRRKGSYLNPIQRLHVSMNHFLVQSSNSNFRIPLEAMMSSNDIVSSEFSKFFPALQEKGWNTQSHHLTMDEWRGQWVTAEKANTAAVKAQ